MDDYCYNDAFYANYIEDKLNEQDKKDFEKHIKTCKKCRLFITNIIRDKELIQSTEFPDLPDKLKNRINKFGKKNISLFNVYVKKIKNSLELIKHNFEQYKMVPALQYKGKDVNESILLETNNFNLEIIYEDNCFIPTLSFNNEKEREIIIENENNDIIFSKHFFDKKPELTGLKSGKYFLTFADNKIEIILE